MNIEQFVKKQFEQALKRYELIEDGDHVLVGLSGGKDSMVLLELLALRSRVFKPKFTVEAAFVKMRNIPYKNDETYLQDFAESLGVKLYIFETEFDETTDERRTHCFLCSWNRRKVLFKAAQDLGCNKIALGHHRDDLMQTALMNLTFEGNFHTMPPRLQMEKFPVELIRPLCLLREKEVLTFAKLRGYRQQERKCPYEDASHRSDMKEMITRFETMNPEFAFTFYTAMERTFPQQGFKELNDFKDLKKNKET